MADQILAYGPPPLTASAADAALDTIDFIAAAVRGIDTIDVTPTMRTLWQQHLAAWYPSLPPLTRGWYYNAPLTLAFLRNQWPYLNPLQQATLRQQWMFELPAMLGMLEPVLQQTNEVLHQAIMEDVNAIREQAARSNPPAATSNQSQAPQAPSDVHPQTLSAGSVAMTNATINFMNSMSNNTINLMHSINRTY